MNQLAFLLGNCTGERLSEEHVSSNKTSYGLESNNEGLQGKGTDEGSRAWFSLDKG